jgi:FG-GAP-like repeat
VSALAVRTIAYWVVSLATLTFLVGGAGLASAAVPQFGAPVKQRVGITPLQMVAGDLNADRKADLATADWTSATVSVLLGRGDGSFRKRIAYRTARHPAGITVGDVDGDDDRDVIVASVDKAGSISVFPTAARVASSASAHTHPGGGPSRSPPPT